MTGNLHIPGDARALINRLRGIGVDNVPTACDDRLDPWGFEYSGGRLFLGAAAFAACDSELTSVASGPWPSCN